ncbi:MAG: hypothetical protein DSY43_01255 [Gammaproteobacteria bacterium]|nr:MAG: hypothetical protein DSY43_01255 [Gammaproteobacteria bacterium]
MIIYRTAIVIREAAKLWTGNKKIYFKQNQENQLKLEELVSLVLTSCTIEEIGFGRGELFFQVLVSEEQ